MRSRYYWICIFALPLLVTLMTMCGDKDTARISLTLEGAPDSTQVVVSRLALNEMQVLDTVYTSGGKTECRVTVGTGSPEFIYLTYGKDGVVSLLLQERDRVSVTAGWSEPSDVLIDGSDESALMQEVNDGIRTFNHRFDSLFAEISSAEAERNSSLVFNDIAVFDWDGNPQELIHTDYNIDHICYSARDNAVYASVWDDDGIMYLARLDLNRLD